MSLQSIARSAFAAIQTAIPEAVVVVVSNGQTANGLRDTGISATSLTNFGEQGELSSIVRVDASALVEPKQGATIKVNGEDVYVTNVRKDSAGALLTIAYSKQKPITFEDI